MSDGASVELADRIEAYRDRYSGDWSSGTLNLAWEDVDQIVAALRATPPAAPAPSSFDEVLWGRFVNHYWDSFEGDKQIVLKHVKCVLEYHAENPPAAPAGGEAVAWQAVAETLCATDGNGFLCDATDTQKKAYELRAKAVLGLFAAPAQSNGDEGSSK